jgi:transposase-like protein
MPKKFSHEIHDRAVRIALDRLEGCPSIWATAKALAPMLDIGPETLRKRIVQVQIDAGRRPGATSAELEEIKRLEKENCDLKEANEILRALSMFFAGELDPRRH